MYDHSQFYKTTSLNSLDSKRPLASNREESTNDNGDIDGKDDGEDEVGGEQSIFPFDYCYVYKNRNLKSKYFLPLLLLRLFLVAVFDCAL
jgi:hypothetical protein